MDHRLVRPARRDRTQLLHRGEPARRSAGEQHRSSAARHFDPAPGDEGWFPPLCAQLLSVVPAGGQDAPGRRYLDVTPGFPLHPAFRVEEWKPMSCPVSSCHWLLILIEDPLQG